jgi:hypothetical protein
MSYGFLADLVVIIHAMFVLFVVLGGLFVPRRRWLAWFHLPAAVWGVVIELGGWICPLTYLENYFRRLAGESGYSVSFIEHYLEPLLYPLGLTEKSQLFLGVAAFVVNFSIYARLWWSNRNDKERD